MKLEKSIVLLPYSIKYGCAATLCPSMAFSIPHFTHIQQRRTLIWVRLLLCFDYPKERVSTSRLVATSTYILYLIANYRYTDNHGHLRTLWDKFLPKFQ
nr:MAG TPA: hypothetical protein [Caudoviricetes sp.]